MYHVLIQVQQIGGVVGGRAGEARMQLVRDVQCQRPPANWMAGTGWTVLRIGIGAG
jgi:hypothetical protein